MKTQLSNSLVIFIYGPTGVGKTDIALLLGDHVNAEIINMDVGQFYTPLSIGTAKPPWKSSTTPHHCFDIINEPKSITVTEYRQLLLHTIKQIRGRGNIPIVVGGSAFYLRSILFPLQKNSAHKNNNQSYNESNQELWNKLQSIDPKRACQISISDRYRIIRALDIWQISGQKPTAHIPVYDPPSDFLLIYVGRDTGELNDRINRRIIQMINEGWIEETKNLLNTQWYEFIKNKKIIGYNHIFDFLTQNTHKKTVKEMITTIGYKTCQYAKRQRTFWRKLKREIMEVSSYSGPFVGCIQEINLTNNGIHLYINELLKQLYSIGIKK